MFCTLCGQSTSAKAFSHPRRICVKLWYADSPFTFSVMALGSANSSSQNMSPGARGNLPSTYWLATYIKLIQNLTKYKLRHRILISFQHVPAGEVSFSWNFLTWNLPGACVVFRTAETFSPPEPWLRNDIIDRRALASAQPCRCRDTVSETVFWKPFVLWRPCSGDHVAVWPHGGTKER